MSKKIKGNTKGLAPSEQRRVKKLFLRQSVPEEIISLDLARELLETASALSRRIGLLLSRSGRVEEVFLGTKELLYVPDLGRYRLGEGRLRRLRFIFSDLSAGEQVDIPPDIFADLEKLRFDLVAGVKLGQNRIPISFAYNLPFSGEEPASTQREDAADLARLDFDFLRFIVELEARHSASGKILQEHGREPAMLVGVYDRREAAAASLAELAELARTAGVYIVDEIVQLRRPDPKTLLGKGKLEEVILRGLRLGAELIIFDTELRPSQWRAITNSTNLKILDRSMLILDVFAQRATSSDGRLQVELAQLKYNLPRLVEKDAGLSRLTGGIGGRGPGETKLEVGRRRSRDRIRNLEKRIDKLSRQRQLQRKRQQDRNLPVIAILGYTNVGKSTLFNALTQSDVTVEDKLFATLDPARRKLYLPLNNGVEPPESQSVILSDTVGFIRDLPAELMSAFRATLEELFEADLLVHVLDASDPDLISRREAVDRVLADMQLADVPQLLVLNKCDLAPKPRLDVLERELSSLQVSGLRKEGLDLLRLELGRWLQRRPVTPPCSSLSR